MPGKKLKTNFETPATTQCVTVVLAGGDDNPQELGVYHLNIDSSIDIRVANVAIKIQTLMAAYEISRTAAKQLLMANKKLFDFVIFPGHLTAIG